MVNKQVVVLAYLGGAHGVSSIVDVEVVVTVELESLEAEHEALKDGVGLEGDHALEVALAPGH